MATAFATAGRLAETYVSLLYVLNLPVTVFCLLDISLLLVYVKILINIYLYKSRFAQTNSIRTMSVVG